MTKETAGNAAFGHLPVLCEEAVSYLLTDPDGRYVDATYGRGGHADAILRRLGADGRLLAFDRDHGAVEAGMRRHAADRRFCMRHTAFAELPAVLDGLGWSTVLGVLLDLGVSSPQLDEAARGFSFRQDGPLDMRMDQGQSETAASWLAEVPESELRFVLRELGEERFAGRIASAIVAARSAAPLRTTRQLVAVVEAAMPRREKHKHPATRTFQAIRMRVNDELGQLERVLEAALERLAPGGRLVVISFHSLEDRRVKRFMQHHSRGDSLPSRLPVTQAMLAPGKLKVLARKVRADESEQQINPRTRSAVLRAAERV